MLLAKFESLKRKPFYAVCADTDGGLTDSKFSGIPWLSRMESWPKCKNCDKEMQLLLQLNLTSLPKECEIAGSGLLQLFYCTNKAPHCEVDCDSWFWNDKAMLVRMVVPDGEPNVFGQSPVADAFPAKVIRRWEAGESELPRVEELVDYVELSEEEQTELYDAEADETYAGPEGGDKLGGWPCWIQSVEYPECTYCKENMKLVFQIDSQVNLPYMWGDSGCGHVTQCPQHPDVIAFGWACM
jgi:uncharacterized protein YwqG